jgi:hypothetical protein
MRLAFPLYRESFVFFCSAFVKLFCATPPSFSGLATAQAGTSVYPVSIHFPAPAPSPPPPPNPLLPPFPASNCCHAGHLRILNSAHSSPHALFSSLCTVVIAAVITVRTLFELTRCRGGKENRKRPYGGVYCSVNVLSASRLLPLDPLLRPSLPPSLRPSTLEDRGQDRGQDLGCSPSRTAIDVPPSLWDPRHPFSFRLSIFAYLRPGRAFILPGAA